MNHLASPGKMPAAADVAIEAATGLLYGAVAWGVYHGGHGAYRAVEGFFGDADASAIGVDMLHTGLGGAVAAMGVMVLRVIGGAQEAMHQHFSGEDSTHPYQG